MSVKLVIKLLKVLQNKLRNQAKFLQEDIDANLETVKQIQEINKELKSEIATRNKLASKIESLGL